MLNVTIKAYKMLLLLSLINSLPQQPQYWRTGCERVQLNYFLLLGKSKQSVARNKRNQQHTKKEREREREQKKVLSSPPPLNFTAAGVQAKRRELITT